MATVHAGTNLVREWNPSPATLERYEEDVFIFVRSTPADRRSSAERTLVLQLLREGHLSKDDGCVTFRNFLHKNLGQELEQDVSEHYERYLHGRSTTVMPEL